MRQLLVLASAIALVTATVALSESQAAPVQGVSSLGDVHQTLIEKTGYRFHCWRWHHICAGRWGWGTWRLHRCLVIHGCV
jgi:hypothetical protein